MPRKRCSEEQIIYALRTVEAGANMGDACRQLDVSEQTYFRWRKQYAGLGVSELRWLKQLEEENASLKCLVADLSLDKRMLQEVLEKSLRPARKRPIVDWLTATFAVSKVQACRLMLLGASSYWYHPHPKDRRALLLRLKELAFTWVRYGYRRLTILFQRECWKVGKRLVYQRYRPENLLVRTSSGRSVRPRLACPWPSRWRRTSVGQWTSCPSVSRTAATSGC
jgi:putative transposase